MEKVLNQDEIDAMFRAARGGAVEREARQHGEVRPCNFRQAGQISSDQVHSISALHEGFARNLTHWLGAYLRTVFECNLVSVEQIPYREVLSRIPDVAYLASFKLIPAEAIGALQLDLSLAFPIIDVLLGGRGSAGRQMRDVTEIEEQILEGVVKIICRELQTAWQPLGLQFAFDQRQQPSQMQRLIAPNEMTLSLSLEMTMPEAHGTLNLIFPSVVSNALLRKISQEWAYHKPHANAEASRYLRSRIMDCPFDVEIGLLAGIRAAELAALQTGNVVVLGRTAETPASVIVSGVEMFSASPVRRGRMRAGQVIARMSGNGREVRVDDRQ